MNQKRKDRRVQRTRLLLQEALVNLILEKGYEALTVQDILDRANIGRSTFYAHFQNKAELLLSGFEDLRGEFENRPRKAIVGKGGVDDSFWELSLVWFQHAQNHRSIYKALVGRFGGDIVSRYLSEYFSNRLREHLRTNGVRERNYSDFVNIVVHHTVSSLLSLTGWWLDHDTPYAAEQMERLFRHLTKSGIETLLRHKTSLHNGPS